MDVGDFLKNFAIDTWYKAVMYLGGVVTAVSFFVDVKGLTNHQLQLLSGGAFLIGLGEWKNHKPRSQWKEANAYTGGPGILTWTERKADLLGVLFDLIGVFMIGLAIWRIFRG
jgi:hypothetical protein